MLDLHKDVSKGFIIYAMQKCHIIRFHSFKAAVFITNPFVLFWAICIIYGLSWLLQDQMLLNRDVSWLLQVTERFSQGGQYVRDFFEVDPPGILYVYMPVIYLMKHCALSVNHAFLVYVFVIALLSLGISYHFLKKMITDAYFLTMLMVLITAIFLIFPIDEFGQKEHFLVLLAMPYILYIAYLNQYDQQQSNWALSSLIGIMAGIGFCIKPYFLVIPLILELYQTSITKDKMVSIRIDTGWIVIVFFTYCFLLLSFHKPYLQIEIPLLLRYFYPSIHVPLKVLLLNPVSCFFYLTTVTFWGCKRGRYPSLSVVLMLSLCGFFLAYLAQRTVWYYHLLPVIAFAVLLMVILVDSLRSMTQEKIIVYMGCYFVFIGFFTLWVGIAGMVLMYFPLLIYILSHFFTNIYFSSKASSNASYAQIYTNLFISLIFDCVIFFFGPLDQVVYLLVIQLLIFVGIFTRQFYQKKPLSFIDITCLLALFLVPVALIYHNSISIKRYNQDSQQFVQFIDQHAAQKNIYFFSTGVRMFPYVTYSHAFYLSRFEHLVILPGLLKNQHPSSYQDNTYFRQLVLEDLRRFHPHLIFVNTADYGLGIEILKSKIDYIGYFSQEPEFKIFWKNYHLLTKIKKYTQKGQILYHYDVYQKNQPSSDA